MFDPQGPSLFELAVQALSSTTQGYDLLARKFEHTPFRTPDALLGPMVDCLGPAGSIDSALDICCGTGAAMRALRPLCRRRVTGIDLSPGMLSEASRRVPEAPGSAEVELVQGDALDMPFVDAFDVATCCGAFGHILHADQDAFARSVRRALKPGGRFVFITRPMPTPAEPGWWMARGFNAAMHVRNALISPPFIMFYLTFTLERARQVLERHGFSLEEHAPYQGDWEAMRVVVATAPGV